MSLISYTIPIKNVSHFESKETMYITSLSISCDQEGRVTVSHCPKKAIFVLFREMIRGTNVTFVDRSIPVFIGMKCRSSNCDLGEIVNIQINHDCFELTFSMPAVDSIKRGSEIYQEIQLINNVHLTSSKIWKFNIKLCMFPEEILKVMYDTNAILELMIEKQHISTCDEYIEQG